MKGFGIEIKNDLLEKKHIEQMGVAIWLYMWLLDKMTSITEEGVGNVLGGKPIVFREVGDELGISIRTYRRWTSMLENAGYINTIRTPKGLVISVNKAHKRFGKGYAKSGTSDMPEAAHHRTKSGTSNIRHNSKTIQLDNTIAGTAGRVDGVKEVIDEFKEVNPSYARLFANKTQRAAAERLIKKYGMEKVVAMVGYLSRIHGKQFAPSITTPYELEAKLGKLVDYARKEKTRGPQLVKL